MSERNNNQEIKEAQRKQMGRRLDALGWGLFFIWIGIAFLFDVGWGAGFIGVGVIILAKLIVREYWSDSSPSGESKVNC
ncbi:MAG: hypothetical protein HY892_20685 [Deltaproteobacteria bacterium]|nr:hypothetical protein [Deltaproteobacteria bacterium]